MKSQSNNINQVILVAKPTVPTVSIKYLTNGVDLGLCQVSSWSLKLNENIISGQINLI